MYAAIRQYELGAGSVTNFMRIVDQGIAETLASQPGFVSYHVLATGADEVVSVTMFDDEQGAIRSNEIAAEFVRDRLAPFQINLTAAFTGEVGVSRIQPRQHRFGRGLPADAGPHRRTPDPEADRQEHTNKA